MKRRIYLNEDGIPTVKSEEGVLLVDEEGVIQFKRKGSIDLAVVAGSFPKELQKALS